MEDNTSSPSSAYPFLDQISYPRDLANFTFSDLENIAAEIRKKIIHVLSSTGGHLASNLGTVDLILALHKVFNSPKDHIIFDVGHQTYAQKLLTKSNISKFEKIRQSGGLSGFCDPQESPHDLFYTGHAGNALSLALGLVAERDLENNNHHIISVIGDATLSCGLTFEALNNMSTNLKKFIIIINDNDMSISRPVGAIFRMLNSLLNSPRSNKFRRYAINCLRKIPTLGPKIAHHGYQISSSVKNLFSQASFFEKFGLSYVGPIDGHNIAKLVQTLEALKNSPFPIILHCITCKGKSLPPAQSDPISYHGVPGFDPLTCKFLPQKSTAPTFPKIFGKEIQAIADYRRVVAITPAMSLGSCLEEFRKKFPERFFDVGIAEGHAVTFAGGLAKKKTQAVFCVIYSSFLQRALDNVFHDVCLQKIPVIFAIDRAGIAFEDGPSHHGIYDLGFLVSMPHMIICQPRNGDILKDLLHAAPQWQLPTAIRYPKIHTTITPDRTQIYRTIGQAEILLKGEGILIIALGHMNTTALEVATILTNKGFSPTVLDPIFLKPFDASLLGDLLLTHDKVITIEEHSVTNGLGAIVNNVITLHGFNDIEVLNFGIPDSFLSHATPEDMMEHLGLTGPQIAQRIINYFYLETSSSVKS